MSGRPKVISDHLFEIFGSIYYVISLGIQHHNIRMFYIQSKYIVFTLISNKIYKHIPPAVHFMPVTIVQKQAELSIYF